MKPDKKIRKIFCQYLKKEYEKGDKSGDMKLSCWILDHLYREPKIVPADKKKQTGINRKISACKDEKARDDKGRILDQDCYPNIAFGKNGNTKDHGCGWIAVYNVRKCMGEKVTPGEVLLQVEPGARSGGTKGVNPFYILKLMRKLGYRAEMVSNLKERDRKAKEADSFIVCYIFKDREYKLSGHFLSGYWNKEEESFTIFNGQRAGLDQVQTIKDALSVNTVISLMIAIKKNCQ